MKKIICFMAVSLLLAMGLASCDAIYEEEGDCSPKYSLTFSYWMNLKWADAFPAEVNSVRVYVFDENDVLAWYSAERGDILSEPGYKMPLDLEPGKYKVVAWCGVDNGVEAEKESFSVADHLVGVTTLKELTCRLNRRYDEDGAVSSAPLYFLYHGMRDLELVDYGDGLERSYDIKLTKNTNHVRIVLQHLSGVDLNADDFDFKIEDANGHMGHDNSILDDEKITYRPYNTLSGHTTVGKTDDEFGDTRALVEVSGAIADLRVGRLMAERNRSMKLTIKNRKNGETVAEIPFIDYALLSKDYYEQAYNRSMTDQEFLDREDNYTMTLFLDSDYHWLSTSILIHSWRVVLQDVDVQ